MLRLAMYLSDLAFFTMTIASLGVLSLFVLNDYIDKTYKFPHHDAIRKHLNAHRTDDISSSIGHMGSVFLEIGAVDGVTKSTTYNLEKKYNWTGILIEPDVSAMGNILLDRSLSKVMNIVICPVGHSQIDFEISDRPGGSGTNIDHPVRFIKMKCSDLNIVCPKHVDFMSVSTVGSEMDILETFNFTAHNVTFIHIANNTEHTASFMEKKKYKPVYMGDNIVYTNAQ